MQNIQRWRNDAVEVFTRLKQWIKQKMVTKKKKSPVWTGFNNIISDPLIRGAIVDTCWTTACDLCFLTS